MTQKCSDIELMQFHDGEVKGANREAVETFVAADPDASAKLTALKQVGETVQTYLELESDAQDTRLEHMWSAIERGIESHARPKPGEREVDSSGEIGLWTRLARWFGEHRGHFITGTVTAGAVAALLLLVRPQAPTIIVQTPPNPPVSSDRDKVIVTSQPSPTNIEDLDVVEGSPTVFTVPGEGNDSETTIIYITRDKTAEGPL